MQFRPDPTVHGQGLVYLSFRLRSLTSSPRVSVVDVEEEKGPEDRGVFFWKGLWGLGLYAHPLTLAHAVRDETSSSGLRRPHAVRSAVARI